MALSNLINEPQREIAETVVGIVLVGGFLTGDYYFGRWFQEATAAPEGVWALGMVVGIMMSILSVGLVFFVHFIGEEVCDTLQRHNVRLRPEQRYGRR